MIDRLLFFFKHFIELGGFVDINPSFENTSFFYGSVSFNEFELIFVDRINIGPMDDVNLIKSSLKLEN